MAGGRSKQEPFLTLVERLDPDRFLPFEPENEQGVVYVFARAAEKLGFDVEGIQSRFPDCLARYGKRKIRIEFEFRSQSFKAHQHNADECDLVVCWKHDWPTMPTGLQVLELRKLFGLAQDAFIIAYNDDFWKDLPDDRESTGLWSVPSTAGPGDLLLIYRPAFEGEEGAITDVFRVHTPVERVARPQWRDDPDWMASIQRVASLRKRIPFSRMRELGIQGGIEARPRRTEQWPVIYAEIEQAGPSHSLKRWAPIG